MTVDNSTEASTQSAPPREFRLGQTTVLQKGRVSRLSNPTFGTAYLIDVTDREDPTREEPGRNMGEVLKEDLEDPEFNDKYNYNNGVIAAITDKLDPQGRKRVYAGISTSAEGDPHRREITMHILHSEGFQKASLYVAFSFDSGLVRPIMAEEIMAAARESGDPKLFEDFPKDPKELEA